MLLRLSRNHYPIKSGWASSSPSLGITAHGRTQDIADLNLQRAATLFLAPFQRQGVLRHEVGVMGLNFEGDEGDLVIALT